MAIFEREVEQRRQHLRGEFDRDAFDPVERLAVRQTFDHRNRALADQRFERCEIGGADHRIDGLALHGVARLVGCDETRHAARRIGMWIDQRDRGFR